MTIVLTYKNCIHVPATPTTCAFNDNNNDNRNFDVDDDRA
jgi:hypothetical protein